MLPPDISLNFLKWPYNILFIFKIMMKYIRKYLLKFIWVFKNRLIYSFSLLAELFRGFFVPFSLLVDEFSRIFENWNELSISF